MAAGLGFKDFTTGEVLTAADVDGYLMQGVWVFASAAARTSAVASPQEGNFSYLKDTNSTEYYTGSAWTPVSAGGGGKVLQVVSTTYGTQVATTSTSFIDSNLSLAITPSSATSKVLVFAHCSGVVGNAVNAGCSLDLLRGASSIIVWTINAGYSSGTVSGVGTASTAYLDSPATTSSTTYKVQFRAEQGNQVLFNGGSSVSMLTLMEIGA